jgi:hypothetical protein
MARRGSPSWGRGAATVVLAPALALALAACGRHDASASAAAKTDTSGPAPAGCGSHAACGREFFVDAIPGACAAGAECAVVFQLTTLGDFHVNDQYPYRFKAADAPDVSYLGTDGAGKSVFSKAAGDWQRTGEKTGTMKVRFTTAGQGERTIAGTLKLSVCSAETCLLDQRDVTARVRAD